MSGNDAGYQFVPYPPAPAGSGGGAPVDATYVTMSLNATLTNERKLTAGAGITIVDGGPNGNVTISASGTATFDWGKYLAGRTLFPLG